jgi:hypothetical protein
MIFARNMWPKAAKRRLSASEGRADVPLRRRQVLLKQAENVAFLCFPDYQVSGAGHGTRPPQVHQ